MPCYRDAVYGGEKVKLDNDNISVNIYRRKTGWGWAEIYSNIAESDKPLAVLEDLGQIYAAGFPRQLRLEADDYQLVKAEKEKKIKFNVSAQEVSPPEKFAAQGSLLQGEVVLTLSSDNDLIYYELNIEAQESLDLYYIRGPWLRVGANSFGINKEDAIFPGIDWVKGDEWSSGTDWFEDPQALRVSPHPYKVAIPVMAISHKNTGIGLSWKPEAYKFAMIDKTVERYPQPVFATPNFVDRRHHQLMGLMLSGSCSQKDEENLNPSQTLPFNKGQQLKLAGEISLVEGNSLDIVLDWVKRKGLPAADETQYGWEQELEKIMKAYNNHLWQDGKGWAPMSAGDEAVPRVPYSVSYYVEHGNNDKLKKELEEKLDWCRHQQYLPEDFTPGLHGNFYKARPIYWLMFFPDHAGKLGEILLDYQGDDGSFVFDPEDRHATELIEWAEYWRPLGEDGESVLDLCATSAAGLILAGRHTDDDKYLTAARKTLDYALQFEGRPEGGDWWETPLRAPNLLAAANAAIAYYLGYEEFGEKQYRDRAVRWLRSIIPFTHLWEPSDISMLYNTKPCFCSTCWFLSDWVAKHVQWEVLSFFAYSEHLGIDWAEIDTEIDWYTFQKGVTTAVLRWTIDSEDPDRMARFDFTEEGLKDGSRDLVYADYFDPVNNIYGGGPIMPEFIADNIVSIVEKGDK